MSSVKLFFVGDFCSKPSTSFISVSDELKSLIQSCDAKIVNFEVPLKPNIELPDISYERFFQNDDAPDFLRTLGFNLFSISNNHMFDWGDEGFYKTKAELGESSFGAGTYDEAYRIKIIEIKGIKIGFMALSYAAFFGVFDDVMQHDKLGCAYINDLRVNHDIIEAKKHVDYLFILPHDGIEYIDVPLPETMARYRDFIDYGADGVIASHSHCPQGWEEYKGKPIFYSLGNFFFNSKKDTLYRAYNRPHWYEGLCVMIEIENGQLKYDVYCTKNTDNVLLSIDNTEERLLHNEKICSYLSDSKEYKKTLIYEASKIVKSQELPIINSMFYKQSFKLSIKLLLRRMINIILLRENNLQDRSLINILKNDSRRSIFIRALKNGI